VRRFTLDVAHTCSQTYLMTALGQLVDAVKVSPSCTGKDAAAAVSSRHPKSVDMRCGASGACSKHVCRPVLETTSMLLSRWLVHWVPSSCWASLRAGPVFVLGSLRAGPVGTDRGFPITPLSGRAPRTPSRTPSPRLLSLNCKMVLTVFNGFNPIMS
jgi:hypothetical protein